MYAHVHTHTHTCAYTHTHTHAYTHKTHVHKHSHIFSPSDTFVHKTCTHAQTHACSNAQQCTHTHTQIPTNSLSHAHTFTNIPAFYPQLCVHTHLLIFSHTHTHPRIHSHTHKYTTAFLGLSTVKWDQKYCQWHFYLELKRKEKKLTSVFPKGPQKNIHNPDILNVYFLVHML